MKSYKTSLEFLSQTRKDLWHIQDLVQKRDSPTEIHRKLGVLSNSILDYIIKDLLNTTSYTEFLESIKMLSKNSDTPMFADILKITENGLMDINAEIENLGEDIPLAKIYIHARELLALQK